MMWRDEHVLPLPVPHACAQLPLPRICILQLRALRLPALYWAYLNSGVISCFFVPSLRLLCLCLTFTTTVCFILFLFNLRPCVWCLFRPAPLPLPASSLFGTLYWDRIVLQRFLAFGHIIKNYILLRLPFITFWEETSWLYLPVACAICLFFWCIFIFLETCHAQAKSKKKKEKKI